MHDDEDTTTAKGWFDTHQGTRKQARVGWNTENNTTNNRTKVSTRRWMRQVGRSYFKQEGAGVILSCKRKGSDGCGDTYFRSSNGSSL